MGRRMESVRRISALPPPTGVSFTHACFRYSAVVRTPGAYVPPGARRTPGGPPVPATNAAPTAANASGGTSTPTPAPVSGPVQATGTSVPAQGPGASGPAQATGTAGQKTDTPAAATGVRTYLSDLPHLTQNSLRLKGFLVTFSTLLLARRTDWLNASKPWSKRTWTSGKRIFSSLARASRFVCLYVFEARDL